MNNMNLSISRFISYGICALLTSPLLSYADDASRNQEIAERFAKCDVNKDDKLTLGEAKGYMPRIYSNFSYIDPGNQGSVMLLKYRQ